jgi:hypothetical protein
LKQLKFAKGYYVVIESYEGDGDYRKTDITGPIATLDTAKILQGFVELVREEYEVEKVTRELHAYISKFRLDIQEYIEFEFDDTNIEDVCGDLVYDLGLSTNPDYDYPYRECDSSHIEYYETDVYCECYD